MVHQIPAGRKRQFSQNIIVHRERRISQPEDQSFERGISLEMDTYDFNQETGNRDRKTGRTTVRFPSGEGVSDFWEQNRKLVLKERTDDSGKKGNVGKQNSKKAGSGSTQETTSIAVG